MRTDLNHNWSFHKYGDNKVIKVDLPHDAMLDEKRYASCRNGVQSGYFPGGRYVYSRKIKLNEQETKKEVSLIFEGVYRNATVSVNGNKVSTHKYGFSEFRVNISDHVQPGDNTVEVDVDNSLYPNCRWYTGSGIYRSVWLEIKEKGVLDIVRVQTVSTDPAIILVETDEDATVEIFDSEHCIYQGSPGEITINDARLWSAEHPYLYRCKVTRNGETREEKFGIRSLEWSGKKGLLVNGESVLLRGGCIHHDNGVLGACSYRDAEYRRIRIMKQQGFNTVRMAHNPCSRYLLEACDELGMYVMDEAFDGWYVPKEYHDFSRDFYSEYKDVLKSMVEKDYNHPCVIMYSVGNEVTETASEKGIRLCGEMKGLLHQLDNSRPVTCGINVLLDVYARMGIGIYKDKGDYRREPLKEDKAYKEKKSGSAFFNYWTEKLGGLFFLMSKGKTAEKVVYDISKSLDIVGLNYASSRYDRDAKKYPDRLMVGSETMSGNLPYNWERVRRYPQLIGDFVWSGWDYLGETCMGWTYQSYPGLPLLSGQGMIDITGLPLAQMEFMKTVWGLRDKPYIGVRPLNHHNEVPSKGAWQFTNALESWSWHGYEGKKTVVEVYSNSPYVRLLLNGREIKTAAVNNCKALFKVEYQPGVLKAIELDKNRNPVSENSLITAEKNMKLTVRTDRNIVRAGSNDLVYAEIEFTDEHGNLLPYVEQRVEIMIDGNSVQLQGFGSALTKTDEVFNKSYHNSYRGRCLAVFRAADVSGESKVTVSSGDLKTEFNIEVI